MAFLFLYPSIFQYKLGAVKLQILTLYIHTFPNLKSPKSAVPKPHSATWFQASSIMSELYL